MLCRRKKEEGRGKKEEGRRKKEGGRMLIYCPNASPRPQWQIQSIPVETMPKNRSYHDYLIKSLKQPEEAAAYIQAILEEKDPEPELLLTALRDAVTAKSEISPIPQEDKQNWDKLQELLTASGGEEIYRFWMLLNALGLRTDITVFEEIPVNDRGYGTAVSLPK
ncbi:MAG: DNA-binding protein [Microcoleus sp.]